MEKWFKKQLKTLGVFLFMLLVATAIQAFTSATWFHSDRVVVWVFDVGQGDAIFIDAPDAQILIDGGAGGEIVEKLTAVMPFWDRHIDIMINTHPHADHVSGLNYVLDRYLVDEVWVSGQEYNTDVFAYFEEVSTAYTDVRLVHAGEELSLGRGATLEVLWPLRSLEGEYLDDPNAGSIVTKLVYKEASILLTGDIGVEEERALAPWLGKIDVLKVGHQGSKTSTAYDFLEAIDPRYSIISVGENSYGHPHEIVLHRLDNHETEVLRTDLHGDIRIVTDGNEPTLATFDL